MLIYHRTSILESPAQTVVNTVNCVGVMGKGIAHAYKRRYPDMFKAYKGICEKRLLAPGKLWLWHAPDQWVLNFPTKEHWRNPSRLEWIELGLQKFIQEYARRGIVEISFPRLGCGNGGLEWDDVRPLMERCLSKIPIHIYLHDYEVDIGMPEHMEAVTRELSSVTGAMRSFDIFVSVIQEAIRRVGGSLIDLQSRAHFSASCDQDAALAIEHNGERRCVDPEDLRGIWLSLAKGLLTRETVEWSAGESASSVMSVLSMLPDIRAVQVQRPTSSTPEIALEFRRQSLREPANSEREEQFALS